ncbi:MAG: FkbM family methyltransferase [Saprospiraceae bacterium]
MIKLILIRLFTLFKIKVISFSKLEQNELLKFKFLLNLNIKTILDIGANEGQFAKIIRKALPTAFIYSFEPIPQVFDTLRKNFSGDPYFKAFNLACGKTNEVIEFNKNNFSPSSSILEITSTHTQNYIGTDKTTKISVQVVALDSFKKEINIIRPYVVKMDTQGYEKYILQGGESVIKNAKVIFIELSYQPIYSEQALFPEIYNQLTQWGFIYHGNLEEGRSPISGEVLVSDGIFINTMD